MPCNEMNVMWQLWRITLPNTVPQEKGKVPRECLRPLAEGESTDTSTMTHTEYCEHCESCVTLCLVTCIITDT
jgi:hypothetical protein